MITPLFPNPTPNNARFWAGRTVGLFGGSFNPAHEGHRLIAKRGLIEYNLDCVWWMVSPQNPLKPKQPNAQKASEDFQNRLNSAKIMAYHPHMLVTDIERRLGTAYSYQTVQALLYHFPKTRFLWLAGLDNAYIFDRWDQWQALSRLIPFVFFNRPQSLGSVRSSRLFMSKSSRSMRVLTGMTRDISSTHIRTHQAIEFGKNRKDAV